MKPTIEQIQLKDLLTTVIKELTATLPQDQDGIDLKLSLLKSATEMLQYLALEHEYLTYTGGEKILAPKVLSA